MTSGSGACLVDTNVLVYAYDIAEAEKRSRAVDILERLRDERRGVLTTQALSEFFVTVTRKLRPPVTVEEAERSIRNYTRSWSVLSVTPAVVVDAARGVRRHQLSF